MRGQLKWVLLASRRPHLTIKRVAHGLWTTLNHLRVLRESAFICV
jgi:hypothetical protein